MENSSPRYTKAFLPVALLLLSLGLASCGGGDSSSSSTTTTVSKITVTPATGNVSVGQTQRFFAAVVDVNNNLLPNSVTWTSTATNVATIDANGIATGVAPGTAQISAASGGVTSNTSTLTVVSGVASVTIEPMSSSVAVNGTKQFTATALDSSGKPVTGVSISWFSSFSGVATIDSNGLVTGMSPGTVTIVASVGAITSPPAVLTVTP